MVWTSCARKRVLGSLFPLAGERGNAHASAQLPSPQHKRPATPLSGGLLFLLSKGQNKMIAEHTLLDVSLVA